MRGHFAKSLCGERFGRLTVVSRAETVNGQSMWNCICDCGNQCVVRGSHLRGGKQKSCGCYRKEVSRIINTTHGQSDTRLYHIWQGMIERCRNYRNKSFKDYGARGISVCGEWLSFQAFMEWSLKNGYTDLMSIDRIDVNRDYSPENCRWVTMKQQQNNRRDNLKITFQSETHTLKEWCDLLHLNYKSTWYRLKGGEAFEEIAGFGD